MGLPLSVVKDVTLLPLPQIRRVGHHPLVPVVLCV
jgi:hypothetical protein